MPFLPRSNSQESLGDIIADFPGLGPVNEVRLGSLWSQLSFSPREHEIIFSPDAMDRVRILQPDPSQNSTLLPTRTLKRSRTFESQISDVTRQQIHTRSIMDWRVMPAEGTFIDRHFESQNSSSNFDIDPFAQIEDRFICDENLVKHDFVVKSDPDFSANNQSCSTTSIPEGIKLRLTQQKQSCKAIPIEFLLDTFTFAQSKKKPRQEDSSLVRMSSSPEILNIQQTPPCSQSPLATRLSQASNTQRPVISTLDEWPINSSSSGCYCSRSSCLKKYCTCFAAEVHCDPTLCKCTRCENLQNTTLWRRACVLSKSSRLSHASQNGEFRCSCKRRDADRGSRCIKRYCPCFHAKKHCSRMCRCIGCLNIPSLLVHENHV